MLRIQNLYKWFDNGSMVLENINLQIQPGEIISLLGASGWEKSTLLQIIAGLDSPSSGRVIMNDVPISMPHPKIAIAFQKNHLMPQLTVWDNVRYSLRSSFWRNSDFNHYVATQNTMAQMGLTEFSQAFPHQLSNGIAQRVAIARALVTSPAILLLDEPFSALESGARTQLQTDLLNIWEYDRPTLILVTDDVEAALRMSDRVIVMHSNPGRIYRAFTLNLPRPRQYTNSNFQRWKERLLEELDWVQRPGTTIKIEKMGVK